MILLWPFLLMAIAEGSGQLEPPFIFVSKTLMGRHKVTRSEDGTDVRSS